MENRHIGRKVQFRDKTGADMVGTVVNVSSRYGSMELIVGGKKAFIRYPFSSPTSRFLDPSA